MRPTNPLWYLAAFLIALASTMAATVVAAGAWQPVRDATITPVTEVAQAQSHTLAVFSDIRQPDRDITCEAVGTDKRHTPIPAAPIDLTVDDEGNPWYLIGLLREGADGLKLQCTPRDKRVDNATYGYAVVSGYADRTNTGKGIAILGVTLGGAFGAYVFWCRRERRKEAAHASA